MTQTFEVRARWLWWIDQPPIENASLTIVDDRIVRYGPASSNAFDLGDVCILPSFVNSHTHLEFSGLAQPIAYQKTFASWIANVVQHRRSQQAKLSPETLAASRQQALRQGLQQSHSTGTGLAVDMVTEPWSVRDLFVNESVGPNSLQSMRRDLDLIAMPEVLGMQSERQQQTLAFAEKLLSDDHLRSDDDALKIGVSPHAPYSTPITLVQESVQLAKNHNCLISMHLAETLEELQWLDEGKGPIAEMLERFVPNASTIHRGSMQDYLQVLSNAPKALVVHGNFLTEADLQLLEQNCKHMAVVYCPRTHAYFGHSPHPWRALLERGISVFLGTDSLASNPDLDVLGEARFLFNREPSCDPQQLLEMITTRPRSFLSAPHVGNAAMPKRAVVVPCEARKPSDIAAAILSGKDRARSLLSIQQDFERAK